MSVNVHAAWIGFFLGCAAGAVPGLFFHNREWLGGYASWRRRMIRLAHISFFGLGFLNLGFALTAHAYQIEGGVAVSSLLLIVGAVTMPLVCYLSAWSSIGRHLFFIPALSVTSGVALFAWKVVFV